MEDFVLAEIIVNAVPVSMVTNARKVRMIILLSLRLCTIYNKIPENPVGKYCSVRFRWEIFESNGTSGKVVLFSRSEYFKRKYVFRL